MPAKKERKVETGSESQASSLISFAKGQRKLHTNTQPAPRFLHAIPPVCPILLKPLNLGQAGISPLPPPRSTSGVHCSSSTPHPSRRSSAVVDPSHFALFPACWGTRPTPFIRGYLRLQPRASPACPLCFKSRVKPRGESSTVEPARSCLHHVPVPTLFRGPVQEAPAAGSRQARAPS